MRRSQLTRLTRLEAAVAAAAARHRDDPIASAKWRQRLHADAPACVSALRMCRTIIDACSDPSGDVIERIAAAIPDSDFAAPVRAEILENLAEYRRIPLADREARHLLCSGGYLQPYFEASVAAFLAGEPEPPCPYVQSVGGWAP